MNMKPLRGGFTVPKNKQLTIYKRERGSTGLTDIMGDGNPLILDENVSLNFSSDFQPLVGSSGIGGSLSGLIDLVGGASRSIFGGDAGFSSQFEQLSLQTWKSTSPMSFKTSIKFAIGQGNNWNAKSAVMDPISKLVRLVLPGRQTGGNLIPPGPTAASLFEGGSSNENLFEQVTYHIAIGTMFFFEDIIIKSVQPTYSPDVDTQGYPVSGSVEMDFESIFTATKNMYDDAIAANKVEELRSSRNG